MHRLNCCRLMVLCLAVTVIGCAEKKLGTDMVEGIVTLDGKIVENATVTFQPVTEGQGVSATGITDNSGKYKLTAVGAGAAGAEAQAGTLPGEYYVGVVKLSFGNTMSEEEAEEKGVDFKAQDEETDTATHAVPQKYNNPKESGIKVTVKPGANDIPIKLTSEADTPAATE